MKLLFILYFQVYVINKKYRNKYFHCINHEKILSIKLAYINYKKILPLLTISYRIKYNIFQYRNNIQLDLQDVNNFWLANHTFYRKIKKLLPQNNFNLIQFILFHFIQLQMFLKNFFLFRFCILFFS